MSSRTALFFRHLAQTSAAPLALYIRKAKGIYLYGDKKRYMDLISGIAVSSVGHGNKHVLHAIRHQCSRYLHLMVYGELIQSPQVRFAQMLASTLPDSLQSVFFVNSGSEAVEGALKLAKRYTGRSEIVSCFDAYHGSTHAALSVGGGEYFKRNFRPLLPDIRQIRFNNPDELAHISEKTACVIVETIQGEAGVRLPDPTWLQKLRARCTETGCLLILDEVQCGAGRTGKFWAFEHFQVIPDILLTAKAIGGGMPIGAFISSQEIMSVLTDNPVLGHITTFGGHPVSCAAGAAAFKVTRELMPEVPQKDALFRQHLRHEAIIEIRALGLMMAVSLGSAALVRESIRIAIENGLLTDWFLYCDDAIRIAPPLIIQEKEIIRACKILKESISKAQLNLMNQQND